MTGNETVTKANLHFFDGGVGRDRDRYWRMRVPIPYEQDRWGVHVFGRPVHNLYA